MFHPDNQTGPAAITALPHRKGDRVDRLLGLAADTLRAAGLRVAGVVQRARPGQAACCSDFYLEELASGTTFEISQRLGREARGCRLDYGGLAAAHAAVEQSLNNGADALILNRFGYSEAQGHGLRPLIDLAVSREIPLLISVNDTYRAEWQAFCGDFARDLTADRDSVATWARQVCSASGIREDRHGQSQTAHSFA